MKGVSLNLESFDLQESAMPTVFLPGDRLNSIKQEAFQNGYEQGKRETQSDLNATTTEASHILARKLQEIGFSHFEARKAILTSLEPLVSQMVSVMLPGIATDALADIVSAQVVSIASLMTDGPIRISCAPKHVATLQSALSSLHDLPLKAVVSPEANCENLEVRFTTPSGEQHIDLTRALEGIREAVAAYYSLISEEKHHA